MASIFTRILNGEIPGHIVAEDDDFFAILDIFPLAKGHTLVVPKKEVDYIFNLDPELLGRYMVFAQVVAKAIKRVIPCKRIGVAVIGLEVPHSHIHLVPINHIGDIDFSKPKLKFEDDVFVQVRESIRGAFNEPDSDFR
ncbi:MAG: HIT family protein [Flavobacteriales bacterium]